MMRLRAGIVLLAMLAMLAVPARAAEHAVVLDIDGAIGPAVADYVVKEAGVAGIKFLRRRA